MYLEDELGCIFAYNKITCRMMYLISFLLICAQEERRREKCQAGEIKEDKPKCRRKQEKLLSSRRRKNRSVK